MAMAIRLSRPFAIFVVSLLLFAALVPAVGAGPAGDGPKETRSEPPAGEFTSTSAGEEPVPLYSMLVGPSDNPGFGNSVSNLGDVDGDSIDDLLVGMGYMWLLEDSDQEPKPDPWDPYYNPSAFYLSGREDRAYNVSQLDEKTNVSSMWSFPAQRWLGDVNGDGLTDMVSDYQYYGGVRPGTGEVPPGQTTEWDYGKLLVFYGNTDGIPDSPDRVIDTAPPDMPENYYGGFSFGGVGDVNGDGYNDLFVYRHRVEIWEERKEDGTGSGGGTGNGRGDDDDTDPDDPNDPPEPWPEPKVTIIPPDFQLFFGSEDGLPEEPDWNGTPEFNDDYYYLQGIHHADVNGDGYDDIILSSTSAPHISIHHGSAEGISLESDRTITFNSQYSYGWRLTAPVNVNGDEYEDFIVDYGQTEGLLKWVQYIYTYQGSELGIPTRPSREDKLDSHEGARVVPTDINGDGLQDILLYAVVNKEGKEGVADAKFQVHFNSGAAFPASPNWQYVLKDLEAETYSISSDGGDFDGDGYGDAVIGIPGAYLWYRNEPGMSAGRILFIHGAGIMDLLRPLTLVGGPVLYAGYTAYDFRVNANPTGATDLPWSVSVTFDPDNDGPSVMWDSMIDSLDVFMESSDPEGLIEIQSDAGDAIWDQANNTVWLHFRVLFDWDWPDEEMTDVRADFHSRLNTTAPYVAKDLFRVENDLDLLGDLVATGEFQGDLDEGAWVRMGEEVTLSGPVVVYEGTTDVYPPSGVCHVSLQDNDDYAVADLVSGEPVSVSMSVDLENDPDERLTLSLQDLPGLATVVSQPAFAIRVDGILPTFTNAVPDEEDWHSSSQVLVSITVDDALSSGVRSSSIEYAISLNGGSTFTAWTVTFLETTGNGPTADAMVLLDFPDGTENFIRWRAMDLVGNGHALSPNYRIKVDTQNVTYFDAFPDPNVWQTSKTATCGVTILDLGEAGIQVSSIQYRLSHHNLSGYGEWTDWEEGSQGDAISLTTSLLLQLEETPFNYVQWRAIDLAGNGYTTSPHYKVKVDATPLIWSDFEPVGIPQDDGHVQLWINVSDGLQSSGVDMVSIEFSSRSTDGEWSAWSILGMTGTPADARFSHYVDLLDGADNRVRFRGMDVAGNGPSETEAFVIVVDTIGPIFGTISPGPDAKQANTDVTVTVQMRDAVIGLDLTLVRYRFTTEGLDALDDAEWAVVPVTDIGDGNYEATVALTLAPGKDNLVMFEARDKLGNHGESTVATIWVNMAPTAKVVSPVSDVQYREEEPTALNATGSSDPDAGDSLNYTWWIDGDITPLGHGRMLSMLLRPGVYNITLVVRDDAGAEDTSSVLVTVNKHVPPTSSVVSGTTIMLIIILVAILAAGGGYYLWKRRSLVEFEVVE